MLLELVAHKGGAIVAVAIEHTEQQLIIAAVEPSDHLEGVLIGLGLIVRVIASPCVVSIVDRQRLRRRVFPTEGVLPTAAFHAAIGFGWVLHAAQAFCTLCCNVGGDTPVVGRKEQLRHIGRWKPATRAKDLGHGTRLERTA